MSNTPRSYDEICLDKNASPLERETALLREWKDTLIKVRTLETQRDEARAEVERLRKALDAGPCDCDGRYICERCHILGKKSPTVATNHTSPEIFKAHGREWYRHDGGPCPCDPAMRVNFLTRIEAQLQDKAMPNIREIAGEYRWNHSGSPGDILYWRPADAPEKLERK